MIFLVFAVYSVLCSLMEVVTAQVSPSSVTDVSPTEENSLCDLGWTYEETSQTCFRYYGNKVFHSEAVKTCDVQAASLTPVKTQSQWAVVRGVMTSHVWLGLARAGDDWVLSDGQRSEWFNWAPGEPNNYDGSEDCVIMKIEDGTWNDIPCAKHANNRHAYFCFKSSNVTPIATNRSVTHRMCDEGWTYEEIFQRCLRYFNNKVFYLGALNACASERALLPSVTSESQWAALRGMMTSHDVWLGMTRARDGWMLTSGQMSEWARWEAGEPNNYDGNEDCVVMKVDGGTWNDVSCGYSAYTFFCSKLGFSKGYDNITDSTDMETAPETSTMPSSGSLLEIISRCKNMSVLSPECVEESCPRHSHHRCVSSGECVSLTSVCNGVYDCVDETDEILCMSPCDAHWTYDPSSKACLRYFQNKITYPSAVKACERQEAKIASVNSEKQNKRLHGLMEADIWIGMTDEEVEGSWRNSDGSLVVWTNWDDQEPNNRWDTEHCAQMSVSNGKWNDVSCEMRPTGITQTNGYFCYKPRVESSEDKIYEVYRENVDYLTASSRCQSKFSKLAMPKSRAMHQLLVESLNSEGDLPDAMWLGLDDLSKRDRMFLWNDGSEVTWTQWAKGQPDNIGRKQHCTQLRVSARGGFSNIKDWTWDDAECTTVLPFVCESENNSDCSQGMKKCSGVCVNIRHMCSCDEMRCRNGRCVDVEWRCDGANDCGDMTDEENCAYCADTPYTFPCRHHGVLACYNVLLRCDGVRHCDNGADESNCGGVVNQHLDYDIETVGSKENMVAVLRHIFDPSRHDKQVRPVDVQDDQLLVTTEVQLISMFEIDESKQTMRSMLLIELEWTDMFLKWSDKGFMSKIDNIQVKQENIWTPDITIKNIVLPDWHLGDKRQTLRVSREGLVTWTVHALMETSCDIVVTLYPFDTQICQIQFTTEQSPREEVKMVNLNEKHNLSALHLYGEDGTWEVVGYTIHDLTLMAMKENRDRQVMVFSFYFTRRNTFYLVSFIVPVGFLSLTSCLVFLLPVEEGEKMGTAITVLLAYAVYLTIVTDYLPDTSLHISLLAIYITLLLGLTAISVVLTTFIIHVYFLPDTRPVGHKVKVFTRFIQRVTFYHTDADEHDHRDRENKQDETAVGSQDNEDAVSTAPTCHPLNWKVVSKTLDWGFYIIFSTFEILLTTIILGYMGHEGVVHSNINSTGLLRPRYGRHEGFTNRQTFQPY